MTIFIKLKESCYVLTGDIDLIKNKRRIKSNFEEYDADFNTDDQITIPFSTEDNPSDYDNAEKQYDAILKLFAKFEIDYEKTEQVKNFVSEIDQENENFKDFSQKAKDIRNNIHQEDNFKNFTSVVSNVLTARKLYTLQLLSSYHLAFAQNACNFSVPGAGKTSVVYGAYAYLKSLPRDNPKHIDRLLIISPLSAFIPWENEYKECFGTETSINTLTGISPNQRKNHFYSDQYTEITLISYQSASNDSDVQSIKDFLKRNKVMIVLDEAHRIKNIEGGKWAKAILSIAKYANSRVVLTGTPAPNSYQDLYNLYQFIWPNKDIIGYPVHYLQELDNNYTPRAKQNIKNLTDNISPFFIRVKKTDLGLPPAVFQPPIIVKMSQNQRMIYDYIEKKYVDSFERDNNTGFRNKLKKAKLIRLMQCVTNPKLLNKPLDNYLDEDGEANELSIDDRDIMLLIKSYRTQQEVPVKFKKTLELIRQINNKKGANGKVIVWSFFIQTIHDLKKYLNDNNIECELLYGAIPVDQTEANIPNRKEIIQQFHQENCPYKVIIANPFAVGESISLHKACHNAIYLEKNFNAAMYMQSKDRIHRYGLSDDDIINYYYLISEDSIDQVIHDRVLEKEQKMLDIIENEEIPLLNINMEDSEEGDEEDIQAIIKDYYARKIITAQ